MDQFFPILGHWFWWVAAGILLIIELLLPGVFFIWLAVAAAATGLLDSVFDLSWQIELLLFAMFSVASVLGGRAIYRGPSSEPQDNPHLNRRQMGYIGRSFTLKDPIVDGRGKLTIEDTIWEIEGPDMPGGTRVKVTAVSGMQLVVAQLEG